MENGDKKIRDAEILSHWYKPLDGFQTSATEFYAAVEQAIRKREIPQIEFKRVACREGGLLSANREYLRVEWKRYIYDICAAPIGTGYYFSSWMCVLKPRLSPWHILGMIGSLFLLFILLFTIIGAIFYIGALFFLAWLLRQGAIQLGVEVEEFLTGVTILVPIIDVYFRPPTYFEIDTAAMFHGVVHIAFTETIDDVAGAKDIPRLSEEERKPIMRDFFRK